MKYEEAMAKAIELARAAASASGDVPVGAIIVNSDGEVIATGANQRELSHNPVAHAEIIAIQKAASAINNWRLDNCTLVVTLEPCAMCAGAIAQARIQRVVFGAWDEKAGAVGSQWDLLRDPRQLHKPEVIAGVMADECAALLADFFQDKR
ncbi:MAG: tRNA adenosine(34) deaminase TadA [Actinomycetales bacterium]|jgi:tRNA(adenine34) deaminase|nr:tRNA adenosine(34) deaminase TadA [Actinomycetales bacterium]